MVKGFYGSHRVIDVNHLKDSSVKHLQQRRKITGGNLRNKYYRDIAPVKQQIAARENEVLIFTKRLAEIEALFADPDHYKDSQKVIHIRQEYRALKESVKVRTEEWEKLIAEAERMTQEFREAVDNISAI